MTFTPWISNSLLNGDMKKNLCSCFHSAHMVTLIPTGKRLAGFISLFINNSTCFCLQNASFLLQLSWNPSSDNGNESAGTSHWLGTATRSIWRRPPRFYPVQTSSALESSCFLARLPSSPQVVSESHPAAICHRLGLPPEILGKKTEHPLLSTVRASMEGQFPLQLFTLKETAGGLSPLQQQQPVTLNHSHKGITGSVRPFKEVAWSLI